MSEELINQKYKIEAPADWSKSISQESILSYIKESDFSQQQFDEGKDFCYFLRKILYTDDTQNSEYVCMAYSVQQPGTLDFASVNEYALLPSEYVSFHRIAVLRDGEWIDKLPDTQFKVLDNENQSIEGVLNSTKKVNFTIKDVRLYDILIIEDTRTLLFTDKDFLRRQLFKYVWITPDVYWGYGKYEFEVINNRTKSISFKKLFFRDDRGDLLPIEEGIIEPNSNYSIVLEDYLNPVDVNREVYPFVDFCTTYSYEELLGFVYQYYKEVFEAKSLEEYALDLVKKLESFGDDLDKKVQYALEYVQNNVRYIFNEEEMHGHKPQPPWETYEAKQGDCKAKTVLLKCILDYLGVESEVVLVNYDADFYINSYLPSLFNFNHVILKINYKGEIYFEDATIKDEYGQLGHRNYSCFINYYPIKEGASLSKRGKFTYSDFAISDNIVYEVRENVGYITIQSTYKYGRANHMRKYFKNVNKKVIIDNMNNFVYNCLDLGDNGYENDKRKIFVDPQVRIVNDDKDLNVFVFEYTSKINNPYILTSSKQKVIKYYDSSILKAGLRDYVQKDIKFWQNFETEFYKITIKSDLPIVQDDAITNQEISLDNKYFKYKTSKTISKNEAVSEITFRPITNIEIPFDDIDNLRENYDTIGKSHYGLGVLIAKPSIFDSIFSMFRK